MREAGLENVEGRVGDPDPVVAVMDVWDPMKFDEIIVSTLPTGSSRWMGLDLPHRLEKLTSVPVRHVVSKPPQPEVPTGPPPEQPQSYGRARRARRDDHAPLGVVWLSRAPPGARWATAWLHCTMMRSPPFSTAPAPGRARASRG